MADLLKPMSSTPSGGPLPSGRKKVAVACGVILLLWMLWGFAGSPCRGEQQSNSDPKLLFLVARPPIGDPYFEHSVVLMVPIGGEPLIVGLIVNKPTIMPLAKLYPDIPALKNRTDNAYMGGPVDVSSPSLIFHAPKPPKQAMLLYDDVYLSFDPEFISKLLETPPGTGEMRLFLGRAQWAPEQLQGEALRGSWFKIRAEGNVIFDRDSEHLWNRMHNRAQPPSNVENWMVQPARGLLRASPTQLPSSLLSPL